MLSNQDKKKIGALVGILVAGTGVLFGALQWNKQPKTIVDEGASGSYQESLPLSEDNPVSLGSASSGAGFASQESLSRISYSSMSLPEQETSASSEKSGNLVVRPTSSASTSSLSSAVASDSVASTSESTESPSGSAASASEKVPSSSTKLAQSGASSSTQSSSLSASERKPEESSLTAEEEKALRVPSTPVAQALKDMPVFTSQHLGNTKVFFYQHPSLSVGLDLRKENGMAEQLFVYPNKEGFVIFPRQMMNLLGLKEDTLKERLKKGKVIPGSIVVTLVDAKKKKELEKADTAKKWRFSEAEDGRFYVIQQQEEQLEHYQQIYGMLEKKLTTQFVAENLSTAGMIGNPTKEPDNVTLGQQQEDWEKLVSMMRDNPAVVEWNWNLPLLAPAKGYQYKDKDLRANVPVGAPNYAFGRADLNGDDVPEYLIHATTKGSKEGVAAGYWAILEPTPSGLKVANIVNEGNGDLLIHDDKLILPTLDQNDKTVSLAIQETNLTKETKREKLPQITFYVTENMTGKELAQKYPGDSLVPMKGKVYRFSMSQLEKVMDYAVQVINEAKYLELIGPTTEAKTGVTNPHGTRETKIQDPLLYLQEYYPDLPLTPDRLKKATSTQTFKNLDAAVTPGDFDRVE